MNYDQFIESKSQLGGNHGFDPLWMPDNLFDFQKHLVEWSCRKGRAALLADCGLGKSAMQLTWAENVVRKTNGRVLVLTPLAVGTQTVREGEKFGVECYQSRDGKWPGDKKIIVTNYEKLHFFNAADFVGCVCDESSILKHYTGATQKTVTRFMSKLPHRLLCTATAAPNDFIELGTSSEALGELSNSEMLARFFRYRDDKGQKQDAALQQEAERAKCHYAKLAFRVAQTIGQWRLKHHAREHFWRWVASWARSCRKPSDLGFDDGAFKLPALNEREHVITPATLPSGLLFNVPALGLSEEREERKRTLNERCEFAARLADHARPVVLWCHANSEGDLLESLVKDSRQICGATPDDVKEEIYKDFSDGSLRALVIKPKIGAWGLNWQHCSDVVTFASHSYEQYYQSVRRCWRFGQKRAVTVDIIATEGESRVLSNLKRKARQAEMMFEILVKEMNRSVGIQRENKHKKEMELPTWLS